jgi:putative hydrolase of the HAD superfamily
MIKAITLDFWDTIFKMDFEIDLNTVRIERLDEVLKKYGVDLPKENLVKIYRDIHKEFDRRWTEEYRTMSTTEVLEMILAKIGVKISLTDFDILVDTFQEAILTDPPDMMEGSKEAIERLSKKYKLGIISDTGFSPGKVLRKILESNGVLDYFSVLIFSDEFGRSKPHSDTFFYAASALGVYSSELAHIGDNERTDILGALNSSMKGILYTKGMNIRPQRTIPSAVMKDWSQVDEIIGKL